MAARTARSPPSSSNNVTGHSYETLTTAEVQSRIDAFVTGTETVSTLSECPVCLRVFVDALLRKVSLFECVFLTRPGFFDAALRLIVALKDANVPALRIRLVENQLRCRHRPTTHKLPTANQSTDPLHTLLDALYLLVIGGLRRGPRPFSPEGSGVNKKHFCRRKGTWPRALRDLFPAGLAQTLDALVFWACVPYSAVPLQLLHDYLIIVRPAVADALLASPRRERLAWATLQALTPASAVPWPASAPTPFVPPAGLRIAQGLRGSGKMVDGALHLLNALWAAIDARAAEPARFVAGLEAQFLGALHGLPDDIVRAHGLVIANYCCMLEDHAPARCGLSVPEKASHAHGYVERCATGYRCSAPGCSRHELGGLAEDDPEDGPTRFARCANCKVTRYCSVACQRAHWAKAAPAHRDVCEVLARLDRRGVDLSGDNREAFITAYNELNEDDAELLFRAAASSSLMPYNRHMAVGL